jgi:hypothetical protein
MVFKKNICGRSFPTVKRNMLGDSGTWLHIMQFVDFGELKLPEMSLQKKYPPLFSMYSAVMSQCTNHQEKGKWLNFSDVCKLLLLNNIDGLVTRYIVEKHTSMRLNQNTYALCNSIVNTLADDRHSSAEYQEAFRFLPLFLICFCHVCNVFLWIMILDLLCL